ncbi:MAG: ABC transporter permease [Phycisphaerales bacterium]
MTTARPRRRPWLPVVALLLVAGMAIGGLPWALAADESGVARYERNDVAQALLPPWWAPHRPVERAAVDAVAAERGQRPRVWFGTDRLGRDVLARCIIGGAVSLGVGLGAAAVAGVLGTVWGAAAGSGGRRVDGALMRTVDVLQGLPTILLVVLIGLAADALIVGAGDALGARARTLLRLAVLVAAIGLVSWMTMARVVRGQTLSLMQQPFMEACTAMGMGRIRRFTRHLLPNLLGPIIVYAALTVPAAMLSESFLSFLGLGVREPITSWGALAADGVAEVNPVRTRWWLLVFPCALVAITLVAMNLAGESVRRRFTASPGGA